MFPIKEKSKIQKGVNYKRQKMQQGDKGSCSVKLAPNDVSAQPFSFIFFLFFSDLKMPCQPAQAQKKKKLCTLAAFSRLQPAVCGEGRSPPHTPSFPRNLAANCFLSALLPISLLSLPPRKWVCLVFGPPLAHEKVWQVFQSQAISGRAH